MKKRALLFGISRYKNSRTAPAKDIPCAENDVLSLSKKLYQLNFETTEHLNSTRDDMLRIIKEFAAQAPRDSLNIIYFSGHGGHFKGENYLCPTDFGARLDEGHSVEDSSINLKNIQPAFSRKVKLVLIIDACRSNLNPGLSVNYSEMAAPENTYIAYATQFEDYSYFDCKISCFTATLCECLLEPNISVDELFVNIRALLNLKHGKQLSNSINGMMSYVTLNEQADQDDIGEAVLKFVDTFGDMYTDKYGFFAGDDLVFIDAAQYCGISVLDAIYKFQKLDAERCHVETSLSESHMKLISFWNMLGHGLKQDEFYTWNYRGHPIRLGEIPQLPIDMQKPTPEEGKEIVVSFSIKLESDAILLTTNLPDNFKLFGKINSQIKFSDIIVENGVATIPFPNAEKEFEFIDAECVLPTITGVDMSIVGDRCRNLVGPFVEFNPINGNLIKLHLERT